jgi:PAS domain S-box-containing protein
VSQRGQRRLAVLVPGRSRIEQANLKQLNPLEEQVRQRTAELAQSNQLLQREVAERKRAGEELQWKTAFLEALVNSSLDGILVVDREHQMLHHNQRFVDIFGIPARFADEKGNENRLHWVADQTTEPEQYIKTVTHLYAHPEEVRRDEIELKDGTILDRYSSPVMGADGKYYGRIWSFRDITGRKRAEQQLRVQTTALDAAANAIVITDFHGTIQSVNAAFTALTGYTAQEAVGQNPRVLKSGAHDESFYRNLWQTISSGQVWSGQLTNRRKDGSLYVEEMTITPLRDAAGRIARYIAIKQDITGRKKAEMEIERQASFPRFNPNPVMELSATGEINYHNEAASVMARAVGLDVPAQMMPPNTAEIVRDCLADGTPKLRMETRIGVRVLSWSFFPVKFNNTVHCYLGDITERKMAEEALFQARKMETVGKLAGGIAHEFNSIMTVIIGQSELLLGDLPPENPLAHNASQIRAAADRAASLTRQLLAFGRGQFFQSEILDLNQVLAGMDGMLRQIMGAGVAVRLVPAAGLKPVKADAGQIEQVIVNMAINARDAMTNGGSLVLETSNVTLDQASPGRDPELKPGRYVLLSIADTGVGISGEATKSLFEPFYTTKDVGKGTGLGLATCYGIIKQSGGHISVNSALGEGATFKIFLPQSEPPTCLI